MWRKREVMSELDRRKKKVRVYVSALLKRTDRAFRPNENWHSKSFTYLHYTHIQYEHEHTHSG